MCPTDFFSMTGNGCNQSILQPRTLGRLWLQVEDADVNAPELVAKRTFLEFELGRCKSLTRSLSDSDIRYGSKSNACVPQGRFNDSRIHPRTCEGGFPENKSELLPPQSPRGYSSEPNRSCDGTPTSVCFVPVFVPVANSLSMSSSIMAALNAKKAVLGETVAQLSVAALKAQVPTKAKKSSSTRTARRANKTKPNIMSNTETQTARKEILEAQAASNMSSEIVERTTIMLRNLPLQYTGSMLLDLLESEGFNSLYNFVYLPSNFETSLGFGYAFVNLVSENDAEAARQHLQGFDAWSVPSKEVCETSWSDPYQGLRANVERYRNSPVMHESVDDKHKPILFAAGVRQPFPAPSKLIKAPKVVHRSIPISAAARLSGA